MSRKIINTDSAPAAIGTYSQAVATDTAVFLSGQIPLAPGTMEIISEDFEDQLRQVFTNLAAVAEASGGSLENTVKLTIYLINLDKFPRVNEIMKEFFPEPYPARAVIGVSQLPKGALVEVDAILDLPN